MNRVSQNLLQKFENGALSPTGLEAVCQYATSYGITTMVYSTILAEVSLIPQWQEDQATKLVRIDKTSRLINTNTQKKELCFAFCPISRHKVSLFE